MGVFAFVTDTHGVQSLRIRVFTRVSTDDHSYRGRWTCSNGICSPAASMPMLILSEAKYE